MFRAAEENATEYRNYMIEDTRERKAQRERIENSPKNNLEENSDQIRSTVNSSLSLGVSDSEPKESKEPERDFIKLRAKIKLASLKRFEEDEKHR